MKSTRYIFINFKQSSLAKASLSTLKFPFHNFLCKSKRSVCVARLRFISLFNFQRVVYVPRRTTCPELKFVATCWIKHCVDLVFYLTFSVWITFHAGQYVHN